MQGIYAQPLRLKLSFGLLFLIRQLEYWIAGAVNPKFGCGLDQYLGAAIGKKFLLRFPREPVTPGGGLKIGTGIW